LHASPPGGLCGIQVSRCRKCEPTDPTDSAKGKMAQQAKPSIWVKENNPSFLSVLIGVMIPAAIYHCNSLTVVLTFLSSQNGPMLHVPGFVCLVFLLYGLLGCFLSCSCKSGGAAPSSLVVPNCPSTFKFSGTKGFFFLS